MSEATATYEIRCRNGAEPVAHCLLPSSVGVDMEDPTSPYEEIDDSKLLKKTLSDRIKPLLRFLQISCYYTNSVDIRRKKSSETRGGRIAQSFLKSPTFYLCIFVLLVASGNFRVYIHTVKVSLNCLKLFSLLHAWTICSIITGSKPLIAAINIMIFVLNAKRHRRLLKVFNDVDSSFWY